MNIENSIFKKSILDVNKLEPYGFIKKENNYIYEENIMDNSFKVILIIKDKILSGKIIDLNFNEEYNNFRVEGMNGKFVSKVKEEYIRILKDIKENCYITYIYKEEQPNRIVGLIKETYGDNPNFEWDNSPDAATFKNPNTKKWYGLIMNVDMSKFDKSKNGEVTCLNIKLNPEEILSLIDNKNFFPAYHMNKKYWISIILNNNLEDKVVMDLIEESHSYSCKNKKNQS